MTSIVSRREAPAGPAVSARRNSSRAGGALSGRCILLIMTGALLFSCGPVMNRGPVPEYRLGGKRAESWRSIKDDFYRNGFLPCLSERKVTVSCSGCTGVILRGVIHIDGEGRMSRFERTFGRYCGDEMPPDVEGCLVRFFRAIEFPPELRGVSLEVDLGRALKC